MLSCWKITPILPLNTHKFKASKKFCCRAENSQDVTSQPKESRKRVLVVGSGWAGLGAAHHLIKQGFLILGFWYPYRNIYSLVDELGIKPFTNWMKSAQYSEDGLEVEFPVFQDSPELPTPLGPLTQTQFTRLPLVDRLSSLPLMAAVVDFDNTDSAWKKYDPITARELLRQFGCSEKLYRNVIDPLLEVRLYAPPEQISAAATLSVLYYYVVSHQKNLNLSLCRGSARERIFDPWRDLLKSKGCEFRRSRGITDFLFNEETGCITQVLGGNARLKADAVIMAVNISTLQEIIQRSSALCAREEFQKVLNLASVDALSVKLRLDRKITIPTACNVCSGFDGSSGWTFFDLKSIYEEHENDETTVLQANFYYASSLLPLTDEQITAKAMSYLSKCIKGLADAQIIDKEITRFPKSLTHFFPGSYKYSMRGSTSFPNLFMAGDWIITRHGSWSQEKSYVTGLEAANRVVDYLAEGSFAKIIPVDEDEPHIEALRNLNRNFKEFTAQVPWASYFLQ
ncbi:Phytoene dehydrogenase [Bienertia sinuspersici]